MMNMQEPQGGQQGERLRVGDQAIQNPYQELAMPKPGDRIGSNRVEVLVGEGGMANVYKVWHEGLEVVRAVKVLKKAFHQESRERFLTEAKILSDINHPNIVLIHNIGLVNHQIPYIEMEYVEGVSLKQLIGQHHRLPLQVALSAVYFVSQALQYAHVKDYTLYGKVYRSLVHRDIKPDNIVIRRDGVVKLMDFGVARPSEVSLHTVGAKIVGTLIYLSPEQLNGTSLDHRSDLFALGCVLYEAIAGTRAFPHKSLQELVQKKIKGEYEPIAAHNSTVPKSVSSIIDRCLALKPDDRFQSAAGMGEAIFASLHELTDRAPQDILSRFMANPAMLTSVNLKREAASSRLELEPEERQSNAKFYWLIALGAIAAAGVGVLIAILMR
ncbi:MAG: serine/threonine protein kinase [Chitinispirillaceae bacterium]|nr:serine/threonine protein kinase [Chitinispirillaceae bacterium]